MAQASSKLDVDRVVPIFALVFVDVLGLTLILPLLHLYAAAYGATALEVGVVVAAFPLCQIIGLPVMGALSDRFGRKPLLIISQITTCAGFLLLGFANSLALIVLSRMIDGLFGANISTAQAALSDVTTDETRAQGLGLTGAAFGLGFVLGPLISIIVLEFTDNLAMPAFVAAAYSFLSILLTLFVFKETLPPEKRSTQNPGSHFFSALPLLRNPQVNLLLLLMFAQQVVFFGFESLLGLFTLSRLGLLGQGNALIFIVVGITLVIVQARYVGRWSRAYGEHRMAFVALLLLAVGLVLLAFTPEQPHPFYVKRIVENELRGHIPTSAEAVIGEIAITLPAEGRNGLFGFLWVLIVILPISVGGGLIRPNLNSLMTKRVNNADYGSMLGLSASFVSLANAVAPLIGGLIFQTYGVGTPFLAGGMVMGVLALLSWRAIKPIPNTSA